MLKPVIESHTILGEDPENLPYESLDEFDKLKINPAFPTDFNDESENEIEREKRETKKGLFGSVFPSKKNKNKMDENIRDAPVDNPKFHGTNIMNDLEKNDEQ